MDRIMRYRTLGFSYVRLLPKDTGVRPIVNLARRPKYMEVRMLWMDVFVVLKAAFIRSVV